MKRFFVFMAVSVTAVLFTSCGSSKRSQQIYYQPQQHLYQDTEEDRVSEWKKEGYKLTGAMSTFTMRQALDAHNNKVLSDRERYVPIMGTSEGMRLRDLTSASLAAQNDAALRYAQAAESVIAGGLAREFSNLSAAGSKLMAAYTQKVAKYIVPMMRESFAIYKVDNEYYTVNVYYIIDEVSAANARTKAIDEALKETATEQVFGTAVNEWVKEFVKTE